jgi:hypothetical protein
MQLGYVKQLQKRLDLGHVSTMKLSNHQSYKARAYEILRRKAKLVNERLAKNLSSSKLRTKTTSRFPYAKGDIGDDSPKVPASETTTPKTNLHRKGGL